MTMIRRPDSARAERIAPLATLPVFHKLRGRRVVLAGASEGACWKAELLAATGADVQAFVGEDTEIQTSKIEAFVTLAADLAGRIGEGLAGRIREGVQATESLGVNDGLGTLTIHRRTWQPEDIAGAALAIGDFEEAEEIHRFAAAARHAGVPVNIIDNPAYCDFQFGAIVNRSPLIVSISTDGAAPVFGQAIRAKIEALLPRGLTDWARAARDWRGEVQREKPAYPLRRRFWERFTARAFADPDKAPSGEDRRALIEAFTRDAEAPSKGQVTFVGAGPGDPDLLTLKAMRALQAADIILYDDLVSREVLELARREAQRMIVGKTGHGPSCKQSDINALMVKLARQGKRVVRLKGGDPLVFGRATEELNACRAAGIAVEIVPGITAAQGAAAALGLSLTERKHARRLQFLTGHGEDGKLPADIEWSAIADPTATTVLYMPRGTLAEFTQRAIAAGLDAVTPAMAVVNATRPEQIDIVATIADLAEAVATRAASGPTLVIIGAVLRHRLAKGEALAFKKINSA